MLMLWWGGISIATVALMVGAGSLWWWLPKWQIRSIPIEDPKDRADVEDNFRKTIGQAFGGITVLIGAGIAYYGTRQSLRVNEDQARLSQQSAHDLLVSNHVSKGFEQLASDKLALRLGGIYALEGVMNSSNFYSRSVLEGLGAFVILSTSGRNRQR